MYSNMFCTVAISGNPNKVDKVRNWPVLNRRKELHLLFWIWHHINSLHWAKEYPANWGLGFVFQGRRVLDCGMSSVLRSGYRAGSLCSLSCCKFMHCHWYYCCGEPCCLHLGGCGSCHWSCSCGHELV